VTEQFVNKATYLLESACLAADTTLLLQGVAGLPTVGTFRMRMGAELLLVTAVNPATSQITVVRGTEQTNAAAQPIGTPLVPTMTAGGMQNWASQFRQQTGQANLTLANGTNSNVTTDGSLSQVIGGPTGACVLGGFSNVSLAALLAGQEMSVTMSVAEPLSVLHNDASSTYKFVTPNGQTYQIGASGGKASFRCSWDPNALGLGSGALRITHNGAQLPITINVREYGATGDGTTDDTTQIKAAIAAFQAAALLTVAGAVRLHFPAGTYIISDELVWTGTNGGLWTGDGQGQTILQEKASVQGLAGKRGMIVRVNCQYTEVRGFTFQGNNHFGAYSSGGSSGTNSYTATSFGYGTPQVGQRVMVRSSDFTKAEYLYVSTVVGNTVTFTKNLVNSYTDGYLVFTMWAGSVIYSDRTIGSALSTHNRTTNCTAGSSSSLCMLAGFANGCYGGGPRIVTSTAASGQKNIVVDDAGGLVHGDTLVFWDNTLTQSETVTVDTISGTTITAMATLGSTHTVTSTKRVYLQSTSDANNEEHSFDHCLVQNADLSGFFFEGQNQLVNRLAGCSVTANCWSGIYAQRGGSANLINSTFSIKTWEFAIGGPQQHPWIIASCASETGGSNPCGMLYAYSGWALQGVDFKLTGYDKKGGPSGFSRVIDVTGYWIKISVVGSSINASGEWGITDLLANGAVNGVERGFIATSGNATSCESLALDGINMVRADSAWMNSCGQTLANGAFISDENHYEAGTFYQIQSSSDVTVRSTTGRLTLQAAGTDMLLRSPFLYDYVDTVHIGTTAEADKAIRDTNVSGYRLYPSTTNTGSLGISGNSWGALYVMAANVGGALTATSSLTQSGGAWSLTGNAASLAKTTSGALTIDGHSEVDLDVNSAQQWSFTGGQMSTAITDYQIQGSASIHLTTTGANRTELTSLGAGGDQVLRASTGYQFFDLINLGTFAEAAKATIDMTVSGYRLYPTTDNTGSIGLATARWGLIRGTVVTSGDLLLEDPDRDVSTWLVREEKSFVLLVNKDTGERRKIATEPLTEDDERELMAVDPTWSQA
jgi:hypothetical protein